MDIRLIPIMDLMLCLDSIMSRQAFYQQIMEGCIINYKRCANKVIIIALLMLTQTSLKLVLNQPVK